MKKIGIITFHKSYNCGSMLQTFALQTVIKNMQQDVEVIDFSNSGQQNLYGVFYQPKSVKEVVKNLLLIPHKNRIKNNNFCYEEFLKKNIILSPKSYRTMAELEPSRYSTIVAGSDQIWNITIDDSDDAYFLPWAKGTRKVAYAPSFGARNILEHSTNPEYYANCLNSFDELSIREENGRKWIKELIGKDVPVVLDPTLLLDTDTYNTLIDDILELPDKYIFYYAPQYDNKVNNLVDSISKKLQLPVIAFNAKKFYTKNLQTRGFILPEHEDPKVYLELIKNAEMVITTSFHGTIFSSLYRKKFWVVRNGGMLLSDDRVKTMTNMLDLDDRVISLHFDKDFDYSAEKDYSQFEKCLSERRKESYSYLKKSLLGE